jgi:cytochrome b6-f complex subunit 7
MSAESMLFNGAFLLIGLTLIGLAWGFVIIKLQGGEE